MSKNVFEQLYMDCFFKMIIHFKPFSFQCTFPQLVDKLTTDEDIGDVEADCEAVSF